MPTEAGRSFRLQPPRPAVKPRLSVARHAAGGIQAASRALAVQGPSITGSVWLHPDFPSAHLGNHRDVWVYLPPGYDGSERRRYPVLYMHDGDNLFSAATAFAGVEWGLDETAEWLIGEGLLPPLIIVGVAATPDRTEAYTWVADEDGDGGEGRGYARFLVDELKPFVDQVYRTSTDRSHTGTMGSSLGGLISLYLGAFEGDTFGRIGALSPSVWWADGRVLTDLADLRTDLRLWVDVGEQEGDDPEEWVENLADARSLAALLRRRGYRAGRNFLYWEGRGQGHDEAAWSERAGLALLFLFGEAGRLRPLRHHLVSEGPAG